MNKKILFPIFLGAIALSAGLAKSIANPQSASFIGEYNDESVYKAYASTVGAQLADEGFVLLKNDGFLPTNTDGAKITIAGKSSWNLARGGAGSGSGSIASGVTSYDVYSSMEAVGCETNQTLKAFYCTESNGRLNNNSASGPGRSNGNDSWKGNSQVQIGETPVNLYTDAIKDSMDEYNDFAIQVITREGSEGCDVKAIDARDFDPRSGSSLSGGIEYDEITDKHALELSDNEEDLFELLKEHFDNIIIVINSSNIFECGVFEKDPQVSAVLWIGNPGDVGPGAIGRIISGEVNPSGHTVDTWYADFKKDPTYQNFSDNAQTSDQTFKTNDGTYYSKTDNYASQDTMFNPDGTPTKSYGTDKNYNDYDNPRWLDEDSKVVKGGLNGVKPSAYVSYEEGIYMDYRYYETKYQAMKDVNEAEADAWYEGEEGVVYPFGYGLSYTTFSQEIVSSNLDHKLIKSGNLEATVTVNVKNTGNVAGKEVVELYWRAPYTDGGIEKANKVLCAFDKTDLLEPGEEQELTLKFFTQDMADYDFSDANENGFKGYELDGGKYQLVLGKNAHEEIDTIDFEIAEEGIKFETDRFTGHEVINRFTDRGFYDCLPIEGGVEFEQMSREDLDETFPLHPTIESRTLEVGNRVEEFFNHEFTMADIDVLHNYEYVPEDAYKTKADIEALGWEQGNGKTDVKFTDLLNTDIDDPQWKDFMDQLTYDEMIEYVYGPSQHNKAIDRLSKPSTGDSDGPQKFRIMWWVSGPIVAATYNVELAKKQGDCYGMEAHLSSNTYGWAGPGVNIHRSPFGGRNFEYYSADPFLTGRIAGRVVAGASDRGIYCFFKHFVVNDQEKNREGTSVFMTEQTLRQIYLKPFQMCIQEGKSLGLMSSYNRLGMMETAASYPLLTEVLRDEWGFKGSIISDMTHSGNSSVNFKCYENINNRALSGCDQQLDNGGGFKDQINCSWDNSKGCPTFKYNGETVESYSWWYAVRVNAQRVIWMCARSGVNSKTFITPEYDVELSNVVRGVYEGEVDKEVEIELTLGDEISGADVSIDPFTPLPEGLTFDGSVISGVCSEPVNKFIHVIFENDGKRTGVSFELRIYANGNNAILEDLPDEKEPEPDVEPQPEEGGKEEQKKGCFGDIASVSALMSMLALAGVGVILLGKKKRVTEQLYFIKTITVYFNRQAVFLIG